MCETASRSHFLRAPSLFLGATVFFQIFSFYFLFEFQSTACFSDIFKNAVKGPSFTKEQQKRQNGLTELRKLMTFRQHIRERNHDLVSAWAMVFSL